MKYSVLDLAWAKGTSEPVRAALLEMHRKLNEQDVLLRQALEAFESKYIVNCGAWRVQQDKAIAALKEHLNAA
jgi:hypothetical protein